MGGDALPHLLSLNEFAVRYKISSPTALSLVRKKAVPAVKIGNTIMVVDPAWEVMRQFARHTLHREYFINVKEVCELLGLSMDSVQQHVKNGNLHPVKRHRLNYFCLDDLIEFMAGRHKYWKARPRSGSYKKHKRNVMLEPARPCVIEWARASAMRLECPIPLGADRPLSPAEWRERSREAAGVTLEPSGD